MPPDQLKAFEAEFGKEPDGDSDPWGDWTTALRAYQLGLQHNAAEVERLTRELAGAHQRMMTDDEKLRSCVLLTNGDVVSPETYALIKRANGAKAELAEARNAALEEAAALCEARSGDLWSLYKGRPPYTGREDGRAHPDIQGQSTGAGDCADAIRSLKSKEPATPTEQEG